MSQFPWKNAVVGGLVAGLVFVLMEMVLVATAGGGSPWGPPRMMSAIALGQEVLPPPASFDAGIFVVGMIVHFALSVILALIFAAAVMKMTLSRGALATLGAVFGLVVYFVNFYGLTSVYPWFEMARNWITISSHVVFGAILGWWLGNRPSTTISQ